MEQSVSRSLARYRDTLRKGLDTAAIELAAIKARVEETVSETVVQSATKEIANAAQSVARDTARKSWLQWLGSAAVVGMLILAIAFVWGYDIGKASGYAKALDVKSASSWAATSAGQEAYRMDQNGDMQHLIRCDESGWAIEKSKSGDKACFVHPDKTGEISGWLIPER